VVCGGPSSEAAVSRTSAAAVGRALEAGGHHVTLLELGRGTSQSLAAVGPELVFPVTHGPLGEDGCLQGLLEVLELPYVGSGVLASALAANKPHAKVQFRAAGLPVAPDALVPRGAELTTRAGELRKALGSAVVVKPASGGSAIGVGRVRPSDSDDVLVTALEVALRIDATALVERFIEGREVTCGVLEDAGGNARALPPTLIEPRAADWYDFTSRYGTAGSTHHCPAPFDAALTRRIQEVAVGAHRALGARDLSRVDFVVGQGPPETCVTLLEVNTLPGMTSTSLFPEAAAAEGIGFVELCDRLARRAHARLRRSTPDVVPMPP
jgi:D-alanine-D-alanine ligase